MRMFSARRCQERSGIFFPFIEADRVTCRRFPAASTWRSDRGANLLCDPVRWVPEAARMLRAGGLLVFRTTSILDALCSTALSGLARHGTARPQGEACRLVATQGKVQFHPSHGDWITNLHPAVFAVNDPARSTPRPSLPQADNRQMSKPVAGGGNLRSSSRPVTREGRLLD